ncbi:MAG: insulinase family protein [Oscillospiraceae bacterium]|nr:insulinase family protein [Oscillospiraceae bacterium]
MNILTDPVTGDRCMTVTHKSGLTVCIAEQPDFHTASALLGVRFGSVHRQFTADGRSVSLPAGTAHFLEHKLYDSADGDAVTKFTRLGASDNAYTAFDRTVYYFSAQQRFAEALALLLDFVQRPYFTAESLDKERPIIAQEIHEYSLDSPEDRIFFLLLEGLFHRHPVRCDVAGTLRSIQDITPELLYQCHRAFYHPSNLVLCCAGNLTAEEVLEIADRTVQILPPVQTVTEPVREPETVFRQEVRERMTVSKPQFAVGFKSPPVTGEALLRQTLLGELVLDYIAGPSSPCCQRMLSEGLINDTFSVSAFTGESWFVLMAEGESDAPEAVRDALTAEIARVRREGIDGKRFAALKRAAYGDAILSANSPAAAAEAMTDAMLRRLSSPYAVTALLPALTAAEAEALTAERLRPDRVCLAVIDPC